MISFSYPWMYVICGICFSSLAQICMKRATMYDTWDVLWIMHIIGSGSSYLLSFIAYYFALTQFSISKISPIMTIGVVIIVVIYGIGTGESVSTKQIFGILLGLVSLSLILT